MSAERLGCYGLHIDGIAGAAHYLTELPVGVPRLTVEQHVVAAGGDRPDQYIGPDRSLIHLSDGTGFSLIERAPLSAALQVRQLYDDEALLHPMLSGTCSVVNRWHGRDAFHAGAFALGGVAWAVLGDRGRGKSTTLGYLATQGVPIVTDDVVVVQDGDVWSGPAFVDLRPDAARTLGVGRDVGVLGNRHRARLDVPRTGLARIRLAGWIALEWGDEVTLRPLSLPQRLAMLYENRVVRLEPGDPATYLRHAALPAFTLTRPRESSSLRSVFDLIRTRLS